MSRQNDQIVLLFDGECSFCTSATDWISENVKVAPRVLPYQWADLDSYGITEAEAASKLWLLTTDHHYGGASALSALLRNQPTPWARFVGWVTSVPPLSFVAQLLYAIVAAMRDQLPGGTPACRRSPGGPTGD